MFLLSLAILYLHADTAANVTVDGMFLLTKQFVLFLYFTEYREISSSIAFKWHPGICDELKISVKGLSSHYNYYQSLRNGFQSDLYTTV